MSDHTMIFSADSAAGGPLNAPRMADDERKRRGDTGPPGTAVITKTKTQTKKPSLYRVCLLYTSDAADE